MTLMGLDRPPVERHTIAARAVTFLLPMPPAAAALHFEADGGGRMPTPRYLRWKRIAAEMLKLQNVGRMPGHVEIDIQLEEHNRSRNCDNAIEPILDLLCAPQVGVLHENSARSVRKITAEWSRRKVVEGARVTIRRVE
jgi:hypothetical protein